MGGSALSGDFELDLPQAGLGQALLDAGHLHADDAALGVEVEDDARPHLLGLDDRGVVEPDEEASAGDPEAAR